MSDPFWASRTEDAGGLVRNDSDLPDSAAWRRLRLSQELTSRWYPRIGLVPHLVPVTGDIELTTGDCALHPTKPGRLDGEFFAGAGTGDWDTWVRRAEELFELSDCWDERDHERCFHLRAEAAFPLMWQVGLLLRTAGRTLTTLSYEAVVERCGGLTPAAGDVERAGLWVAVSAGAAWCALSPTGRAYAGQHVIDLAARHRAGAGTGELAAAVEDRLAWQDLTPEGRRWQRLMRLAGRAGLPTARLMPDIGTPAELMVFASDDQLAVVADLDAGPALVDTALAYALGLAYDRDITVMLPAGRESRTLRRAAFLNAGVRVWIHDGHRVAPAVVPARVEVLRDLARQRWTIAAADDSWPYVEPFFEAGAEAPFHPVRVLHMAESGDKVVVLAAGTPLTTLHPIGTHVADGVLGCLDEVMWALAVRAELAAEFAEGDPRLEHRLLLGMPGALHPLHPAQLEAIDVDSLSLVQVSELVRDWPGELDVICTVPAAPPRPAPPRPGLVRRRQAGDRHSLARELFEPLGAEGAARVCETLALPVHRAEPPDFATRADVMLSGTTADGQRMAALLLVRLTGDELEPCPGHGAADNSRRDACRANAPFGGAEDACHLLRGAVGEAEAYPRLLDISPSPPLKDTGYWVPEGGCPFRRTNEPMRLLALGESLLRNGQYRSVAVTLFAPAFEESVQRRWAEAGRMVRSSSGLTLSFLPIEVLLSAGKHPHAEALRQRYGLGSAERASARSRGADARFP
ncbi:beta/alpha barrel domain-containing protein [Actinoplanes sp. RD1]|uniref:hypothetical protein n=1 Tax=Actinoplanes sp. RD1 TaxID=3064538 RepID=UPI002741E303|nr:hypothetical protein [Actinoplanes sp. RD1]